MTKRATITPKRRAEIFRDADGICHLCCRKIGPGETWEVEHVKPLALGGADDADNMRPAHVDCHKGKSRDEIRIVRKADRQMKAHAGVKRTSRPMPGSRASRWKRTLDGRTVER